MEQQSDLLLDYMETNEVVENKVTLYASAVGEMHRSPQSNDDDNSDDDSDCVVVGEQKNKQEIICIDIDSSDDESDKKVASNPSKKSCTYSSSGTSHPILGKNRSVSELREMSKKLDIDSSSFVDKESLSEAVATEVTRRVNTVRERVHDIASESDSNGIGETLEDNGFDIDTTASIIVCSFLGQSTGQSTVDTDMNITDTTATDGDVSLSNTKGLSVV